MRSTTLSDKALEVARNSMCSFGLPVTACLLISGLALRCVPHEFLRYVTFPYGPSYSVFVSINYLSSNTLALSFETFHIVI